MGEQASYLHKSLHFPCLNYIVYIIYICIDTYIHIDIYIYYEYDYIYYIKLCLHIIQHNRSRLKKITSAVRETGVSWHDGGSLKGLLKPPSTILLRWQERFHEGPQLVPHDVEGL